MSCVKFEWLCDLVVSGVGLCEIAVECRSAPTDLMFSIEDARLGRFLAPFLRSTNFGGLKPSIMGK